MSKARNVRLVWCAAVFAVGVYAGGKVWPTSQRKAIIITVDDAGRIVSIDNRTRFAVDLSGVKVETKTTNQKEK